ncbi:Fmn dependent [Favolaschia claudopus]|uniref:Fmn dependent n=1 Tax=Favolaschia claudopus TaxID=2862362 RepID=A0AAW0BGK7_9AGAR
MASTPPTTKNPWSTYMVSVYVGRRGPQPLGTVDFEEIEAKAQEKLKEYPGAFMYAGGSAGTNSTYRANLAAFERYRIVPRMLIDATTRTLETTIFGVKHPSPLFIGPIGTQAIFMEDAELAPAQAGRNLGIPFIMSTAASRTIEDVAEANGDDGHRWFQLYWPSTREVLRSLLDRAKASGFTALVVTLDTMLMGWRPGDLEKSYVPFAHGVGVQVGVSDPVFMARLGREPLVGSTSQPKFPYDSRDMDRRFVTGDKDVKDAVYLGMEWLKECNNGQFHTWEELRFIREHWEGPLVLKGIQSVSDAEKCLDYGVDGIIVSNHGGRQVDGAIPSLYALARIMRSPVIKAAQSSGRVTILFDSGIRTGPDIFKALALGAQAVILGRPWLYGGIVAGQEGIEQVLKHTLADLDTTLGVSGYSSLDEIQGKADEVLVEI